MHRGDGGLLQLLEHPHRLGQGERQSLLALRRVHGLKAFDVGPGRKVRLTGNDHRPHRRVGRFTKGCLQIGRQLFR